MIESIGSDLSCIPVTDPDIMIRLGTNFAVYSYLKSKGLNLEAPDSLAGEFAQLCVDPATTEKELEKYFESQ